LNERIRERALRPTRVGYVGVYDIGIKPDGRPRHEVFVADGLRCNADGYKLPADRVCPSQMMPR
jgi:hypothetical protein